MLLTAPDCFSSSHLPFASIKNSTAAVILKRFRLNSVSRTGTSRRLCRASLITSPDSFEVGRLIGSYGFMNITSYSGLRDIEYSSGDLGRLGVQDVGEGSVKIRLYEGRIAQGPLKGTSVMFKVYPGQRTGGIEADMMAANELNAHAFLQSSSKGLCQNLVVLVGGFETKTGEQWLAFRSDGKYSAADYAKLTSEKISKNHSAGESSWNRFEKEQILKRRRYFVIKLFQGAMSGLAYMHDHDRLHQSLGPSSVILKYVVAFTIVEKDAAYLVPRLRDLSFSVDISFQNLEEDAGTFSEGLWRRAAGAGAFTPMEKRAFGIADDMYCLADDRLLEAVKFLDLGEGAGWELLQAMLNPDFRQRPIAEAVINHRFTAGAVL
ncbi:protein kinase domain-containing protein [Citrus sinensis]|nr:protein kinase domain-containing protein [Citrus sinensis]